MNFQNTGDDNRNFLGQLSESRLRTTVDNLAGKRLEKAKDQEEIAKAFEDAYKDLGYKAKVIYTDPQNAPQLIDEKGNPKAGTAYVGSDGEHTIIINVKDPKNSTRSGIIGTISEEGSHIIGKVEGRQLNTGTTEKGLESLGRATNEYFTEKYKKNDIPIETKSDGKDYSNTDFGENVGDVAILYEAPDKNGKRKSDINRESAIASYIKSFKIKAGEYVGEYESRLEEIVDLFKAGKILPYKALTDKEQKEILRVFSEDNVDELGIETLKDGTKIIKIVKENKIDKSTDELTKFKTLAVRDIIKSNISISYQTPSKLNSGDKNLDKVWDRTFKAINFFTPEGAVDSPKDLLDLVYYDFNQPLGEYI